MWSSSGLGIPVRIDFIGGWSDQLEWTGSKGVLNACIGWEHEFPYSPYPMFMGEEFRSAIRGIGTGLGVSSIIEAARNLDKNYIQETLDWETKQGTKGGWQDQMGAIEPGMKIISTVDHKDFEIHNRDDHPILDHIILFDSGVRRKSAKIGDMVREWSPRFKSALTTNLEDVYDAFDGGAEECAKISIEGFKRLDKIIPMDIDLPKIDGVWGHKLVGAGGGGYGIFFVKVPERRDDVIRQLKVHGMWATKPILLQGIRKRDL